MTVFTNEINIAMLPDVGGDDWHFAFQAALIRSMETDLLSDSVFQDMASSADLGSAVEMLSGSEYSLGQSKVSLAEVENMLAERRQELLAFFKDLLSDSPVSQLPCIMIDMSNLRLALRRFVTEKPIGTDYCLGGSEAPDVYETVFEHNDYSFLPKHMQAAIEEGILAYYQDKDIRDIDHVVDQAEFDALIDLASSADSTYLYGLAKVRADLTNIKTVMRKKLIESDSMDGFIDGGFIDIDKLKSALLGGLDQFANICYATPYGALIEAGIDYLNRQNSFLRLESLCDKYMDECCELSGQITAGIQPAISYYFRKSEQIRKIRMVLTAKSNMLDKQLILDRLGV
ncbi:MAG: V-type ATPase subunit [Sedimentisphaeraceae bacterium JB056]